MAFLQSSMGVGSSSLAELDDVNIESLEDGDYLTYDPEEQKWINTRDIHTITATLTINGAKEDTISIYDSSDELICTCVFSSGSTSGTAIVDIYPDSEYKFVSSIAKGTTSATYANNYVKTVTLTDDDTQTINVYPDGTLYWYGNNIGNLTFNAYAYGDSGEQGSAYRYKASKTPSISINTNNMIFTYQSYIGYHCIGSIFSSSQITIASGKSLKLIAPELSGFSWFQIGLSSNVQQAYTWANSGTISGDAVNSLAFSSNATGYLCFEGCKANGTTGTGQKQIQAIIIE